MSAEGDPSRVNTTNSSAVLNPALDTIKKEVPDCEVKLESEWMIEDEDAGVPSIFAEQQVEPAHIDLPRENPSELPEEVIVKIEDDSAEENSRSGETRNQRSICDRTMESRLNEAVKDEDMDVDSQMTQREITYAASPERDVAFPMFSVKMEDYLAEDANCWINVELNEHVIIGSNKAIGREVLSNQIVDEEEFLEGEDTQDGDSQFSRRVTSHVALEMDNFYIGQGNFMYKGDINSNKITGTDTMSNDNEKIPDIEGSDSSSENRRRRKIPKRYPIIEKSFACTQCKAQFDFKKSLDQHILSDHTIQITLSCPVCFTPYKTEKNLKKHMDTHSEKNKKCSTCPRCSLQFKSKRLLERHSIVHAHRRVEYFSCNLCSLQFTSKHSLEAHKASHVECFSCNQCAETFESEIGLHQHTLSTHSVEEVCSWTQFNSSSNFEKHLTSDQQSFSYSEYSTQFTYTNLQTSSHSDQQLFPCTECSVHFIYRSDLEKHLLTHSESFSCTKCSAYFKYRSDLETHLRTHSDLRPYPCTKCSLRFNSQFHLESHLLTHFEEQSFPCPHCSDHFKYRSDLISHLLTHSDQQAFPCAICSSIFESESDYQKHMLKHEENRFPCLQCGVCFTSNETLSTHAVAHDSLTCQRCLVRFQTKEQLKLHFRAYRMCAVYPEKSIKTVEKETKVSSQVSNNIKVLKNNGPQEKQFSGNQSEALERESSPEEEINLQSSDEDNNRFDSKKCQKNDGPREKRFSGNQAETENSQGEEINLVSSDEGSRTDSKGSNEDIEVLWQQGIDGVSESESDEFAVKPFSCEFCSTKFKTEARLKKHVCDSIPVSDSSYPCPNCTAQFKTVSSLCQHLEVHVKQKSTSRQEDENEVTSATDKEEITEDVDSQPFIAQSPSDQNSKTKIGSEKEGVIDSSSQNVKFNNANDGNILESEGSQTLDIATASKNKSVTDTDSATFSSTLHDKHSIVHPKLKSQRTHMRHTLSVHAAKKSPRTLPSEKVFFCTQCRLQFYSQAGLTTHSKIHSKPSDEESFPCIHCEVQFESELTLHEHISPVHGEKELICMPEEENSRPDSIHLTDKSENELLQPGTDRNQISKHVVDGPCEKLLSENDKPLSCRYCSAQFESEQSLCKHMLIHMKIELDLPQEKANKKLGMKNKVSSHPLTDNEKIQEIKDSESSKIRAQMSVASGHYDWETNKSVVPSPGSAVKSKHVEAGPGSKKFCMLCSAKFNSLFSLESHLKRSHPELPADSAKKSIPARSSKKPFSCSICSAEFSRKLGLLSHSKKHKDEKLSRSSSEKIRHEKPSSNHSKPSDISLAANKSTSAHTLKKTFSCSFCPAEFDSKLRLCSHSRKHKDGEKLSRSSSGTIRNEKPSSIHSKPSDILLAENKSSNTHNEENSNNNMKLCLSSDTEDEKISEDEGGQLSKLSCKNCSAIFESELSLFDHLLTHVTNEITLTTIEEDKVLDTRNEISSPPAVDNEITKEQKSYESVEVQDLSIAPEETEDNASETGKSLVSREKTKEVDMRNEVSSHLVVDNDKTAEQKSNKLDMRNEISSHLVVANEKNREQRSRESFEVQDLSVAPESSNKEQNASETSKSVVSSENDSRGQKMSKSSESQTCDLSTAPGPINQPEYYDSETNRSEVLNEENIELGMRNEVDAKTAEQKNNKSFEAQTCDLSTAPGPINETENHDSETSSSELLSKKEKKLDLRNEENSEKSIGQKNGESFESQTCDLLIDPEPSNETEQVDSEMSESEVLSEEVSSPLVIDDEKTDEHKGSESFEGGAEDLSNGSGPSKETEHRDLETSKLGVPSKNGNKLDMRNEVSSSPATDEKTRDSESFESQACDMFTTPGPSKKTEHRNSETFEPKTPSSASASKPDLSKSSSNEKKFSCQFCHLRFHFKKCLKEHLTNTHPEQIQFTCKKCRAKFSTKKDVQEHLATHSAQVPVQRLASMQSSPKYSPPKQSSSKTSIAKEHFGCPHCEMRYDKIRDLRKHMKSHTEGSMFSCEHCSQKFSQRSSLVQHLKKHGEKRPRSQSNKEKQYCCSECRETFAHRSLLDWHSTTHSPCFTCPHCSKEFDKMSDLKNHLKTHGDKQTFFCNKCPAYFKDEAYFSKHSTLHRSRDLFTCLECYKQFSSKDHLKKHLLTHSRYAFSCKKCSAGFHFKFSLMSHLKIHADKK